MVKLMNTQTMACLLEALGIRKYQWLPKEDGIELNLNAMEIAQAITSSSEEVQYIYGKSPEWQQLCNYYVDEMNFKDGTKG